MGQQNGAECKGQFNDSARKVVNWDEYQKKKLDLEWKEFTWPEKLFQAFVDAPSRMALWVGRAFGEAKDQVMRKPRPENAGHTYYDSLQNAVRGDIYFDRDNLESDLTFFQKYGPGKAFQEKSANIARKAFEESQDFSFLAETAAEKKLRESGKPTPYKQMRIFEV